MLSSRNVIKLSSCNLSRLVCQNSLTTQPRPGGVCMRKFSQQSSVTPFPDTSATATPTPFPNPTGNPSINLNSRGSKNPNPILNPNPTSDVDPTTNLHPTAKRDPTSNRDLISNQEPIEILGFKNDPKLDAGEKDLGKSSSQRNASPKQSSSTNFGSNSETSVRHNQKSSDDSSTNVISSLDPTRKMDSSKIDPTNNQMDTSKIDPTSSNNTASFDPTHNSNLSSKVDPTNRQNPASSFDPTRKLYPNADSERATTSNLDSLNNPNPTVAFDPTRKLDPEPQIRTSTASSKQQSAQTQPSTPKQAPSYSNSSSSESQNMNTSTQTHSQNRTQNLNQTQNYNQNYKRTESTETRKVIVFGGNGFVGSHICQKLVEAKKFKVVSINRSGKPSRKAAWINEVEWVAADVFDTKSWTPHLQNTYAIVSCLGAFSTKRNELEKLNGDTTLVVANHSLSTEGKSVKKFIFVSATEGTESYVKMIPFLQGYLEGKRKVEQFLLKEWIPSKRSNDPESSVLILRPGFIYGSRAVKVAEQPVQLPLHWLGRPLEMLMKPIWSRLSESADPKSSTAENPNESLQSKSSTSQNSKSSSTSSKTTSKTSETSGWTQMLKMMTEPPISVESVASSVVEAISPDPVPGLVLDGIIDVKIMNENLSAIQQKHQHQHHQKQQQQYRQQKQE